ncbi:hypothetical protein L7F22_047371 [Adiantum nelumboides]|nr:hypothetical protein [Adiantum nelumboides]
MDVRCGSARHLCQRGRERGSTVQAPAAAENKFDANETQRLSSVRYFPAGEQSKYCYVFSRDDFSFIQPDTAFLVRAAFRAGNLTLNASGEPTNTFQLLINANLWDDVSFSLPQSQVVVKEAYIVPANNTSLAGKDAGTLTGIPFISSLNCGFFPLTSTIIIQRTPPCPCI